MGLDMYLNRVWSGGHEQVMYWDKANQIHNWILRHFGCNAEYNAQDAPLRLDKEDTEMLLSDLKAVIVDHERAEELLPTLDRFFFGDTDYDNLYFEQVRHTYVELSVIAEETEWSREWLEYSCWW